MTRGQSRAYRFRHALLALAIVCMAAGVFWVAIGPHVMGESNDDFTIVGLIGTPVAPAEVGSWFTAISLVYIGVLLMTQWLFFGPRGAWSIQLADRGRPMIVSIIVAAMMAMLLSAGFVAIVTHFTGGWPDPEWGFIGNRTRTALDTWLWVWATMAGLWVFWGVVFYFYWRRGDRYTQFTRMIRALIAGSVLELLIAAPVHAMARKDGDCYCALPSYTALIFGGTVLLWAFGPGIVLIYLHERYRRTKLMEAEDEGAAAADSPL